MGEVTALKTTESNASSNSRFACGFRQVRAVPANPNDSLLTAEMSWIEIDRIWVNYNDLTATSLE